MRFRRELRVNVKIRRLFQDTELTQRKWNGVFVQCHSFAKIRHKHVDIFSGRSYLCSVQSGVRSTKRNRLESAVLWGDRIFEKCGIRRDEEGDGGKTLEIRGKRRLSARDGGANYQQS